MEEFLTRAFVWVALSGYALSAILQLMSARMRPARWLLGAGAIAFVLHVICAFHFFHQWSHADALAETARQTKELIGVENGGGLYLNYAFTLLWLWDAGYWLVAGDEAYLNRSRWIVVTLHSFFAFMFVNGAVVFGKGPVRWYGIAVIAMMAIGFVKLRRKPLSKGTS